ncbi:MAG: hypothetical protein M1438_05265 [Deltaproteobacteria bacterium]|nr:hypothetical protein [Deltaproteobacteria bacterium]
MTKEYEIHIQVTNGHLRLIPEGPLTQAAVEQLLGVARSALTFFSVLTVDLRGTWEVKDAYLANLEEGLQQLISEKKLALTSEKTQLCWKVHPPSTPQTSCKCEACARIAPTGLWTLPRLLRKTPSPLGAKRG